jgi:hypothetical protein
MVKLFGLSILLLTLVSGVFGLSNGRTAGRIKPKPPNPIWYSTPMAGAIADICRFSFSAETTLPEDGWLVVDFPGQFTSGLGLPLSPFCMIDEVETECNVDDNRLSIKAGLLQGNADHVLEIHHIKNPTGVSSTGSSSL